jgi:hypothetical protein
MGLSMEFIQGCYCFARVYEFDYIPIGFMGRVAVRALHLHNLIVVHIWRDGMIVASPPDPPTGESKEAHKEISELKRDPQVFDISFLVFFVETFSLRRS